MNPSLRKVLLVASLAAGMLVAFALFSLGWLVGTEAGGRWIVARAIGVAPGELEVTWDSGRLASGPVVLGGIRYENEALRLEIERVELRWRMLKLLGRHLSIESLTFDGVDVYLRESADSTAIEEIEEEMEMPEVDLPIDISFDELRASDVAIHLPDGSEPIRVDSVEFRDLSYRDTLGVRRLAVGSPLGAIELEGAVVTRGRYPVNIEIDWLVRPETTAPIRGTGRFRGDLRALEIQQIVHEPFVAAWSGSLYAFAPEPSLEGSFRLEEFRADAVNPQWPPLEATAQATLSGPLERMRIAADGRLDSPEYGRVAFDLAALRDRDLWTLDRLEASAPAGGTRLLARGHVDLAPVDPVFDLEASWTGAQWPLEGEPLVASESGRLRVDGSTASYAWSLEAGLGGGQIPPGRWSARGGGDAERIVVARLLGETLGGRITGTGRARWAPAVRWTFAAEADTLDLETQWPAWPGQVGFALRTEGTQDAAGPQGVVRLERLRGRLRGAPIRGGATIALRGETSAVDTLEVRLGEAHLSANGRMTPNWDFRWRFEAPSLADLAPESFGSLAGHGTIAGPATEPRLTFELTGDSLEAGGTRVHALAGSGEVDLSPQGPVDVAFEARALQFGTTRPVDSLAVRIDGTMEAHRIVAGAATSREQLRAEVRGGIDENTWAGGLERFDLDSETAGDWRLRDTAPISVAPEGTRFGPFCWAADTSLVCLEFQSTGEGAWAVDTEVTGLRLALLEPFLPEGFRLTGGLDATMDLRSPGDGRLLGRLEVLPGPGRILRPSAGEEARIVYRGGRLALESDERGLRGASELHLGTSGEFAASWSLPGYRLDREPAEQPIEGEIRIDFDDLSWIEDFSPDLASVHGTLRGEYDLSGTLDRPIAAGELRLAETRADLPALGLELREIEATLESAGDDTLTIRGQARSGPGRLLIAGTVNLAAENPPDARIEIGGGRFLVIDTEDGSAEISPDLVVRLEGNRVEVNGEVLIPRADLVIENPNTQAAVPVSADVVQTGEGAREAESLLEIQARVRLVLGENVHLNTAGLDADLEGTLVAIEEPGQLTRATGELRIEDGTYKAYGQELRIERGRLFYGGGSIMNPGLDIRVGREADDGVIAGFEIRGTLERPELTLFSDPSMTEEQALSYVVLGRPLGQASSSDASVVSKAANKLGLKGGNLIAGKIGSRFGLDEARIESEGSLEEASLVLGTYLSPRIYVSYGVGLFEPDSRFRLQYELSRKWRLQAEASDESSADLLFTIGR